MLDEGTPQEIVARFFVDHLIQFKGCDHHPRVSENSGMGMKQFIEKRRAIIDSIPEFIEPDFAEDERLPLNLRDLTDDEYEDAEDEWELKRKRPLAHMDRRSWKEKYQDIRKLFTGGEDDDSKLFNIERDDMSSAPRAGPLAVSDVTMDFDSLLALFADLSTIKSTIDITVVPTEVRNLKRTVHISHGGVPLHWIPHFHLGKFGNDPEFDLFILLPALYIKTTKRQPTNLYNHVPEQVRAEFMNVCFLPAIHEVLSDDECQSWEMSYDAYKAKSMAVGMEGIRYEQTYTGFRQELYEKLDSRHIPKVWKACRRRLTRAINEGENIKLSAFKGYQFFIQSKGFKHRVRGKSVSEVMVSYKEKAKIRDDRWLTTGGVKF